MIILDSSFIVAYKIENDFHHQKAIEIMKGIVAGKYGEVYVTDYIFDESVTIVFGKTKKLEGAINTGNGLIKSSKILRIDAATFDNAWSLFKRQKNTKFSFTDCTTLIVMDENRIKNIATFDEDFKKIREIDVIGI